MALILVSSLPSKANGSSSSCCVLKKTREDLVEEKVP